MTRRARAWLAALGVVLLARPDATAAAPRRLVLEGVADRSAALSLTSPVELAVGVTDLLGGPPRGRLASEHLGFLISRVSDGHVVVGYLRSRLLEQVAPASLLVRLGDPSSVVPAGAYRITLIGGTRVEARLSSGNGVRLSARTATQVSVRSQLLSTSAPVSELRVPVRVSPRTFVHALSLRTEDSVEEHCLAQPGATTCVGGDPSPLGGYSVGAGGSGSSSASAGQWQPGDVTAGSYDALFQSVSTRPGSSVGVLTVLG